MTTPIAKPVTPTRSVLSTSALISVFIALVPKLMPDDWHDFGYLVSPILGGIVVYLCSYVINLCGFQSTQELGERRHLNRDLKEIDKQLAMTQHLTPALEQELLKKRDETVLLLTTVSQRYHASTPHIKAEPQKL